MEHSSNLLVVLTGKTASGKDTVMARLLSIFPDFKRVVTTTSRASREGEKNGLDYFFISEADFRLKIDQGGFIEYVEYGGNLYGTEKSRILENLNSSLIWRIDPSRAGQIKEFIRDAFEKDLAGDLLKKTIVIYLTVDDEVILDRLKRRGLGREEIDRRMQEDAKFWQKYKNNYDFVVENVPGNLNETVAEVSKIIANKKTQ